jgi:CxxC-x17-CxxC domain-containing protein
MYEAVCAECGQTAHVPFKPTDDRPVYCKDCYSKRNGY